MTNLRAAATEASKALYDKDNPDSLINRMPLRLVPIFERVRLKMPKVLLADEKDIRKIVCPSERDDRVRLSFWDEFNLATSANKRMSLQSVIKGVVQWDCWTSVYEEDDYKLCWIFTPPVSYVHAMRQILNAGTEKLMEIINLPLKDKDGKVDVKVATLVLKAWQLADMRVKGGIVQRMEVNQRTLQVNANATDMLAEADMQQLTGMGLDELESLERRIDKAKREQNKFLGSISEDERHQILEASYEDYERHPSTLHKMPDVPEVPDLPSLKGI